MVTEAKYFAFRLTWCTFVLLMSTPAYAQAPDFVPGQYLMKLRGSSTRAHALHAQLGVVEKKKNKLTGSSLVEVAKDKEFDHTLAKQLIASGVVEYLEPNYIVTTQQTTPNDPLYSELWGMHNIGQNTGVVDVDIDAPQAWDLHTGDGSVVVGVVDTGVDYTHPDLAPNMWNNPFEIPGNGIDDDGNGFVDDVHGVDTGDNDGDPADSHGHGTHCAGTIAAAGNNGIGVVGVAWNAKIMGLKFLNANGSGNTQDAIEAIEYAVAMRQAGVNIRVLSNSWGGGGYSQALADAIAAANNAGILFIAAAGNSSNNNDFSPTYPANYQLPNVVSVAAIDNQGNLAGFSNFGVATVHLAAPGVDVLSTKPGNAYQTLSGTSMATPHVSGVAALLLSYQPSLSHTEAVERLLQTTKRLSTLSGLIRSEGMVNISNALQNISDPNPPNNDIPGYASEAISVASRSYGTKVLSVDDGYSEHWLPFAFPYYQHSYNRIAISANGRIIPLADGESVPNSVDYTNRLSNAIAPYHDDLYPSPFSADGGVWYYADSNEVRITWVSTHYGDRNSGNAVAELRIQARLLASGEIEYHFLDTDAYTAQWSSGGSATIGLAPGAGVVGRNALLTHNSPDANRFGSGRAVRLFDDSQNPPDPDSPDNPQPPQPPEPRPAPAKGDLDGDGKRDIAVWRPSTGYWFILDSSNDFDFSRHRAIQHGLPGDIPLMADVDHDGLADLVVWRPSNGTWYAKLSASGFTATRIIQWGLHGDTPFLGDYDGDGWDDLGVYRTRTGTFYVLKSMNGFNSSSAVSGNTTAYLTMQLGGLGNDIVTGDFLGDGRDDFVTVWQVQRFWSLKDSAGSLRFSLPWGYPGDTPLACRMIQQERDARVVVRVEPDYRMKWYGVDINGEVKTDQWGSIGDTPACEDYDGDGWDDLRVFRDHTGEWFIKHSSDNSMRSIQFGLPGDIPL